MFGVAMGGIWGLAAATALENLPVELRGLASGIVQQGYAAGYLIAAVINLTLVPKVSVRWRAMFWCASGFSSSAALLRALLPESAVFLRAKEVQKERGVTTGNKTKVFLKETQQMLAKHWPLCIYAVVLMTGELHVEFGWNETPIQCHRFQFLVSRISGGVVRHRVAARLILCHYVRRTCIRHTSKHPRISRTTTPPLRLLLETVYVSLTEPIISAVLLTLTIAGCHCVCFYVDMAMIITPTYCIAEVPLPDTPVNILAVD
jgi:MFS family permease